MPPTKKTKRVVRKSASIVTPPTPEEVWRALLTDREFASQPDAMKQILRPFVGALPTVLADLLDQPATVKTILTAKIAYMRYGFDNGLIEASVGAAPEALRGIFEANDIKEMLQDAMQMIEEIVKDIPGFLQQIGVTERDFLTNPKVGLSGEALSLYDKGQLTIGELLRLQPILIVKNN